MVTTFMHMKEIIEMDEATVALLSRDVLKTSKEKSLKKRSHGVRIESRKGEIQVEGIRRSWLL